MANGYYINFGRTTGSTYTGGGFKSCEIGKSVLPIFQASTIRTTTMKSQTVYRTYLTSTTESLNTSKLKMAGCLNLRLNNRIFYLPLTDVSSKASRYLTLSVYTGGTISNITLIHSANLKIRYKGSNLYPFGSTSYGIGTCATYTDFYTVNNNDNKKIYAINASLSRSYSSTWNEYRTEYTYTATNPPATNSTTTSYNQKESGTSTIYITNSNLSFSKTLAWYIASNKYSSYTRRTTTQLSTYEVQSISYKMSATYSYWTHNQNNWGWLSQKLDTGYWSIVRTNNGTKSTINVTSTRSGIVSAISNIPFKATTSKQGGQSSYSVQYFTTSNTGWGFSQSGSDVGSTLTKSTGSTYDDATYQSISESHVRRITYSARTKQFNVGICTTSYSTSTETRYTYYSGQTWLSSGYVNVTKTSSYNNSPVYKVSTYGTTRSYKYTDKLSYSSYYHDFKIV